MPIGLLPALILPRFAITGIENMFKANIALIPAIREHNKAILQELGIRE
jgi:hypothetical protein